MGTALFKKKDPHDLRTVRRPILFTKKEDEAVKLLASVRRLDVSDFIRRAALGRRADVQYEGQVILELREIVETLKQHYQAFIQHGNVPPEDQYREAINQAIEAMKRISK